MDTLSHVFHDLLISTYGVIPNWGLALILFSLSIRMVLLPLQYIVSKESKKLQLIQPELKRLLERYKETPQTYLTESSKLKKATGVRGWIPFVGALVQIPVFYSIYRLIPQLTALNKAAFLWLPSLSVADPLWILPFVMAALFYLQQAQAKKHQPDQGQVANLPSWLMPAMSFVFMAGMPSALVLHSIVSLVVQMGGEHLFNRLT